MGTDVDFFFLGGGGGLFLFCIANYLMASLLKRQSDKMIRYKCDSTVLLSMMRIDLCMFYCPYIPRGQVESHGKAKKLHFSNGYISKSDYRIKKTFVRTTTYAVW